MTEVEGVVDLEEVDAEVEEGVVVADVDEERPKIKNGLQLPSLED